MQPNADLELGLMVQSEAALGYLEPDSAEWDAAIFGSSNLAYAIGLLRSSLPSEKMQAAVTRLVVRSSLGNLECLAEGMPYIQDEETKIAATRVVIRAWAKMDPAALVRFASANLGGQTRDGAFELCVRRLMEWQLYREAAEVASRLSTPGLRALANRPLAQAWAKVNPREALAWARTIKDSTPPSMILSPILASPEFSNAELLQLAKEAATASERLIPISVVGHRLDKGNDAEWRAWIEGLPEPERSAMQMKIVRRMVFSDVDAATKYALGIKAEGAREQSIDEIEKSLNAKDPELTVKWMAGLPDEVQQRAGVVLTTSWYRRDPLKAVAWINGLPDGMVRNRALMFLSFHARENDSDLAKKAAAQITDPTLKEVAERELRGR